MVTTIKSLRHEIVNHSRIEIGESCKGKIKGG